MYPGPLPRFRVALPGPIKKWAGGWNQDLEFLGAMKQIFFRDKSAVILQLGSLNPLWMAANRGSELEGLEYLVTKLLQSSIRDRVEKEAGLIDFNFLIAAVKTIDAAFGEHW